ncbi:hypothetical protein BVRB_9g203430 [Beta vulgaris subsp. vulgaris]|nr:hypothetical protein BVRB_9g203430 [Beta vulgaris subsp. vulgaris]
MEQNGSKPVEEVEEKNTTPPSMSIDDMIEQSVGRLNVTQILQVLLTTLAPLFDSQQTYISIFAHAQPTWHCTSSNTNSKISCSSSNNSNICRLSKSDWAWDSPNVHTSIISEWDLECASSFITGFPTTCYFVGCLLGGLILATLGDSSLGRKNLLCVSLLVMSLAAFASSFSPNFWVYSIFRFTLLDVGVTPDDGVMPDDGVVYVAALRAFGLLSRFQALILHTGRDITFFQYRHLRLDAVELINDLLGGDPLSCH